jgi:uncharacterized protein YndB with AHSA1/START domain
MSKEVLPPVKISRQFKISPEFIFDAWIKPEIIRKWLFKSPTNEIVRVANDPQPGGAFSIIELTETGDMIDHYGQYIHVDRPDRLEFTLQVPKHFPGVTNVNLTFGRMPDGGCQLHLVQTGVDPHVVEDSWRKMLEQLDRLAE